MKQSPPDALAMERAIQRLLSELREGPVPLSSTAERHAQRERLLPGIRAQVDALPRRRRRARLARGAGWFSMAATLLLVSGALLRSAHRDQVTLHPDGGPLTLNRDGRAHIVHSTLSVDATGNIQTSSPASLTTARGVLVRMDAATQVALDELSSAGPTRLRLVSGHVVCEVPPLKPSQRFSVKTPSAEITVVGTRFSVSSSTADETCVRVSEGRVEVRDARGLHVLGAGDEHGCKPHTEAAAESAARRPPAEPAVENDAARPAASVAGREPSQRDTPTPSVARASSSPRSRLPTPPASGPQGTEAPPTMAGGTLAQQSKLLSRALYAERHGQLREARELYSELLRRYPDSPLTPEAEQGLRRVK